MVKFLLGLLVLSQMTWALPQSMMVCNPKINYKSQFQLVDQAFSVEINGKDQAGQPLQFKSDFQVIGNENFLVSDFKAEDVAAINAAADIKSFTGGTWLDIGNTNQQPSSMLFFEFEPGQYSVLWILQGTAIPLGKTTDCN